MGLVTGNPINSRYLLDVNYIASSSLSTATTTKAFDLIQRVPYPTTEKIIVRIENGVVKNTINGPITGSFKFQHSDDNITFTNISELAGYTIQGLTSLPSTQQNVLLPPAVKRYVRMSSSFDQYGSTNYTGSISSSVLF